MSKTVSKRRMVENEAMFRFRNEEIKQNMLELRQIAKEDGQEHLLHDYDVPLLFYCECSDESCNQRLQIKPSRYEKIHKNRRRFVIICNHEAEEVERLVGREESYCIVEKFEKPLEDRGSSKATSVQNS